MKTRSVYLLALLVTFTACNPKSVKGPDLPFDRVKWNTVEDGVYPFRRRMLNDVQKAGQWTGVSRDSVISVLGLPNQEVEGNLWYKYDQELTIFGNSDNILVFELGPDSTVKATSVRNSGFD